MSYVLKFSDPEAELLPRSGGKGSIAGGQGIGSRGPGETKIELDRRRIRERKKSIKPIGRTM